MIPQNVLILLEPLVKRFEGLKLKAYLDSNGNWTVGWGHKLPPGSGGLVWTLDQAEVQVVADMNKAYSETVALVPGLQAETPGRQTAITDFVYNLGSGTFDRSTLAQAVRRRDWYAAKMQLTLWIHGGGKVLPGLVDRRDAEIALIGELS